MTEQDILLTVCVEECCETGQRATKSLRFGLDHRQESEIPSQYAENSVRLVEEFNDLYAVMEMMYERGMIHTIVDRELVNNKKKRVLKYMDLSRNLNILKDE